jgi:uracil-DNA glycosylase
VNPSVNPSTRRALLQHLESLRDAGVQDLPRARAACPNVPTVEAEPDRPPSSAAEPPAGEMPLSMDQRAAALQRLSREVATCRRCEELARTRTQTVFGVGHPQARLVFLGEAPGADEDRQGEPFVGRAGQLLNDIIAACTLTRDQVYILNILKCRPPGNRNPEPNEAANCRPFLLQQLEILQPEFLCCLGAVAAQNLLDTSVPIGQLRGRFHSFGAIRVMATYHPAYLLRNPSAKRATWEDMQMLMREMGIPIPQR